MYADKEILAFDGTLQELANQFDLLKSTMPKCPAFVCDSTGEIMNRVRVNSKRLTDGSYVWDVDLFHAPNTTDVRF